MHETPKEAEFLDNRKAGKPAAMQSVAGWSHQASPDKVSLGYPMPEPKGWRLEI